MTISIFGARARKGYKLGVFRQVLTGVFLFLAAVYTAPLQADAQQFRFNSVQIEGNQRVDGATILSYAGINRGQALSAPELNDAYQRIVNSGLFETVELVPQGGRLLIKVVEYPTINVISFEGNNKLKDEDLATIIRSQSRRVYSPSLAESDAAEIVLAYEQAGRIAASVEPRVIRRSDNRIDLIFEITEGKVVEIERISFVGNRNFSERRLRGVLQTKQAGLLRQFVGRDTFIADRIEFDKRVLTDFYQSRGYIDFQVLSVNSELTRRRDGFLVTFNVREGQSFKFGEITTVSDLQEIDAEEFQAALKVRPGVTYSPTVVENSIARMERLALQKELNFIRVEPRITRNDRDLTLDVEFNITRGPRVFVERIDIEGNATTLDRVIRRQFRSVEGDPFNPREIREAASRIELLGFFGRSDVNAREGSSPDQVVVDVDVEEQPTGSLSFGLSYSVSTGAGVNISFSERNFLGRGQRLGFSVATGTDNATTSLNFVEPAFLGRDVAFGLQLSHATTTKANDEGFDRTASVLSPSLEFPVSENGRLKLYYGLSRLDLDDYTSDSAIIAAEVAADAAWDSYVGYAYSYDTRRTGLNPNAGVLLRFGQKFVGIGGNRQYIESTALMTAQTRVRNENITLRAEVEGGMINMLKGNSFVGERYFLNGKIRGFEYNGLGPRDLAASNQDALGGNMFAVARFEAEFPIGLPEEYGLSGGVFADVGSVWSLEDVAGGPAGADIVDDGIHLRSSVGVSLFWESPLGPLRFNFSRPVKKLSYDREQNFDVTISTRF